MATVVPAPPRVVGYHHPRLRVACSVGDHDVVRVAFLCLPACIKDSLPDRRSTLVGWLSSRAA
jgi:hypothetical protein